MKSHDVCTLPDPQIAELLAVACELLSNDLERSQALLAELEVAG